MYLITDLFIYLFTHVLIEKHLLCSSEFLFNVLLCQLVNVSKVRALFGPNMLHSTTPLTSVIFFLLVSTHYDASTADDQQVRVAMATDNAGQCSRNLLCCAV